MSIPSRCPAVSGALLDGDAMARIFKALGHPIRLQILQHLRSIGACRCGDLVATLPLAQSTVSQHLKSLRDAGLVTCRSAGTATSYGINLETLSRFEETYSRLFDSSEAAD